ncbi:MAG: TerD family protein [Clostridium sp.]|uniref:TerD family protein n=1 Tax=Clostridium sp. TaxID=1506 RepID=UPI003EE75EA1
MGINLNGMMDGLNGGGANNTPSLNLRKNDILNLTKKAPGLEEVLLGAGWDVAHNGQDFDLDIAAFLLNGNGKVQNVPEDVIFFNNMRAQGIELLGDNRTGAGDGDDEVIHINLKELPAYVEKIVFIVTIFEGQSKRQTFGMVDNSYVRLLDARHENKELCIFNLKENGSTSTAVIFAELSKMNGDWHFKALGEGKIADLNGILSLYM